MCNFLNDNEGNTSTMNLVWYISVGIILYVWFKITYMTGTIQHMTNGDALWFLALISSKVTQNFFEKTKPSGNEAKTKLLEDSKGTSNPFRLFWVVTVLGIVSMWAYVSLSSPIPAIQHFTPGDAAWFTALLSSKVGQTYIERS